MQHNQAYLRIEFWRLWQSLSRCSYHRSNVFNSYVVLARAFEDILPMCNRGHANSSKVENYWWLVIHDVVKSHGDYACISQLPQFFGGEGGGGGGGSLLHPPLDDLIVIRWNHGTKDLSWCVSVGLAALSLDHFHHAKTMWDTLRTALLPMCNYSTPNTWCSQIIVRCTALSSTMIVDTILHWNWCSIRVFEFSPRKRDWSKLTLGSCSCIHFWCCCYIFLW